MPSRLMKHTEHVHIPDATLQCLGVMEDVFCLDGIPFFFPFMQLFKQKHVFPVATKSCELIHLRGTFVPPVPRRMETLIRMNPGRLDIVAGNGPRLEKKHSCFVGKQT